MSSGSITYRQEVVAADIEDVRRIVESSGFFSAEEVDVAVQLVRERLTDGLQSGYQFLFAERAEEVVGYVCFGHIAGTMGSYDLYWIAVRNDLRGAGIGKELLAKAEEEIARQGARRIYIETSSGIGYEPTRCFYGRRGYRQEAVLRDFYSPGDNKVIYVKEIKERPFCAPGEEQVSDQKANLLRPA